MARGKRAKQQLNRVTFSDWFNEHVPHSPNAQAFRERIGSSLISKGIYRKGIGEEELARVWDTHAHEYMKVYKLQRARWHTDFLFQNVQFKGNESVLSIGCGPGLIECFLAKHRVPNGKVTAIDLSPKTIEEAKKFAQKIQTTNIELKTESATRMGLPENSQDRVLVINSTLYDTGHLQPALREIHRVIKKSHDTGSGGTRNICKRNASNEKKKRRANTTRRL